MSTDVVDVKKIDPAAGLRKANECIAEAKRSKPAARLFDEFWREGELALLFGASGVGKSLLAVQVADAMARGTPLHGFVMPTGRRKVLYVDLSLSDAQFRERYSGSGDTPVPMSAKREKLSNADTASVGTRVSPLRLFRFPEKLYRGRPPGEMDLCDWIERTVEANAFQVVIVDDLSAIKRTHDGIRETLACMRRLKQLRDRLGISILVLCDAFEPTDWWVSENDMKRSRVLCTVADSVFAMGRKRRPEGARYVVQTRSRSAQLFWDSRNAPVGTITRLASGLLGFEFDERFTPEMDEEKKRLICDIQASHEAGESFRAIAQEVGISKTYAHELSRKWTPAMGSIQQSAVGKQQEDEDDYWDETEISDTASEWLEEEGGTERGHSCPHERESVREDGFALRAHEDRSVLAPFAAGLGRRSIYDLEFSFDSYGNQIYVETRDEHTGKPTTWYQIDRRRTTRRYQRGLSGIQVEHMNTGPFL